MGAGRAKDSSRGDPDCPSIMGALREYHIPSKTVPLALLRILISQKATHRLPDAYAGRLDDYYYLWKVLRKSCKLLKCPISRTDDMLCLFLQAIRRMKFLASFNSHAKRLPHLLSQAVVGEGASARTRDWRVSDWAYFDTMEVDWEQVLEVGFNLYQAQQCVKLWHGLSTPNCAVALCLLATSGVLREVIPQQLHVIRELSLEFGLNDSTANERFRDIKKFVICWCTSLQDIGISFPQINPPRVGGIGDGFKNYASDLRRGIPENEILCAVTVDVASHWQQIAKARIKLRSEARSWEDELKDARNQAARAGMRLDPNNVSTRLLEVHRSRQFASAMMGALDLEGAAEDKGSEAEDDEVEADDTEDEGDMTASDMEQDSVSATATPRVRTVSPVPGMTSRRRSQTRDLTPEPPTTPPFHPAKDVGGDSGLDLLLQELEPSSDGGSDYSSDEETRNTKRRMPRSKVRTGPGLDLSGLGDSSEPFAFTIGPEGFSRAHGAEDPESTRQITINSTPTGAGLMSASAVSATSQTMQRETSNSTISQPDMPPSITGRISIAALTSAKTAAPKPKPIPKRYVAVPPASGATSGSSSASSEISESSKHSNPTPTSSNPHLPLTPSLSTTPLRELNSAAPSIGSLAPSDKASRGGTSILENSGTGARDGEGAWFFGVLEREKHSYMTNRKASIANAKARFQARKAHALENGLPWPPPKKITNGPARHGRKRKTTVAGAGEIVNGDDDGDGEDEEGEAANVSGNEVRASIGETDDVIPENGVRPPKKIKRAPKAAKQTNGGASKWDE